jgi:hypothetical protein
VPPLLSLKHDRRPFADSGAFNHVYSSVSWGLRKDLGLTNPRTLEFKNQSPRNFAGTSAEAIHEKVQASARTG